MGKLTTSGQTQEGFSQFTAPRRTPLWNDVVVSWNCDEETNGRPRRSSGTVALLRHEKQKKKQDERFLF